MAKPSARSSDSEATKVEVDRWDQLEKLARLLSLIAIPVVLAIVGWLIQNSLSERNVSQEYVKLAVSILKEPKDKTDLQLRGWAADLLNQNSPTKFTPAVLQALKEGQATLPALTAILGTTAGGTAISPDGQLIATGRPDGTVLFWDATSGKLVRSLKGHTDSVTSIAFSPDGRRLLTGSFDNTVKMWDLFTGQLILTMTGHTDGVIGVGFSPDGRTVFTRSLDGTVKTWSADGRLLTSLQLPNTPSD